MVLSVALQTFLIFMRFRVTTHFFPVRFRVFFFFFLPTWYTLNPYTILRPSARLPPCGWTPVVGTVLPIHTPHGHSIAIATHYYKWFRKIFDFSITYLITSGFDNHWRAGRVPLRQSMRDLYTNQSSLPARLPVTGCFAHVSANFSSCCS